MCGIRKVQGTWVPCRGLEGVSPSLLKDYEGGRVGKNTLCFYHVEFPYVGYLTHRKRRFILLMTIIGKSNH